MTEKRIIKVSLPSDRYAEREAEKYDKPVPSREYIQEYLTARQGAATHKELYTELGLSDEDQIEGLRRRLIAMHRDGQLDKEGRDAYLPIDRATLIRGRVSGHRDGFGFLIPTESGDDIFLSNRQMRAVFDGDIVLVRVMGLDYKGRPDGAVVEVLERNTTRIVGRLYSDKGNYFVTPESKSVSQDIDIVEGGLGDSGAQVGQFVTVDIETQPTLKTRAEGRVVEVLGNYLDPGIELDIAVRTHNVPYEWPETVIDEADQLSDEVVEADKTRRVDLRSLPLVTIDGEDARDFDDAVYCERKKSGGWRLFVAIADVSHYVKPGAPLDQEAYKRGTSVYFPGQVIPMLPEKLSNGLCSLMPEVDRLCMVCEITVSEQGRMSGFNFYEAVMHSHARLTYTKVNAILTERETESGQQLRNQYQALVPHIEDLHDLYRALLKQRHQRGALDFESTETRIVFSEERKIERILPVTRNVAHKIIEECMLCANVAAAKFLQANKLPGLFRVHESPKQEKLENLRAFLQELGYSLAGGEKPETSDYRDLQRAISGRSDAHLIETIMLRSLQQAVYTPENEGHFGLGYQAYTHFTSPIRRYPDLLTHRAVRHLLRSDKEASHVQRVVGAKPLKQKDIYPYDMPAMLQAGEHSSLTERRADDASRDVMSFLKCHYMQQHVGDDFHGIISAVTGFGLFVELEDLYVEGLVHIASLGNDYFQFDAVHHCLIGDNTGTRYRLGDEVYVKVVRVDLEERKVDLELVESLTGATNKQAKSRKRAGKAAAAESKRGAGKGSKKKAKRNSSQKQEMKIKRKAQKSPVEKAHPLVQWVSQKLKKLKKRESKPN